MIPRVERRKRIGYLKLSDSATQIFLLEKGRVVNMALTFA